MVAERFLANPSSAGQEVDDLDRRLAALLFTASALESYLNWIGERLWPHFFSKDDGRSFKVGKHHGLPGKLDYLLEALEVPVEKGQPPYQTIGELIKRRNALVHSFPQRFEGTTRTDDPHNWSKPMEISELADTVFVKQARIAIQEVADRLHAAAQLTAERRTFDGDRAFWGTMSSQTTWQEGEPGFDAPSK